MENGEIEMIIQIKMESDKHRQQILKLHFTIWELRQNRGSSKWLKKAHPSSPAACNRPNLSPGLNMLLFAVLMGGCPMVRHLAIIRPHHDVGFTFTAS